MVSLKDTLNHERLYTEALKEALRASEEEFRAVFSLSGVGKVFIGPTGRFIRANAKFCELTRYSADELFKMTFADITHPDNKASDVLAFTKLLKGDLPEYRVEKKYIQKDGNIIWVNVAAAPVHDASGKVAYISSVIQDITDRKRLEASLKESEAVKSAVLQSALDCIISMDHEGKIVDFNSAAEKTFGYTSSEVIGKSMELIIPIRFRENHRTGLTRYLETGVGPVIGERIEYPGLKADGTEFPAEISILRIDKPGPPLFTAFLRDITERKRVDQRLRKSEERLRAIIENEPECVKIIDQDGTVLEMNPAGLAMIEVDDASAAIGQNIITGVSPAYKEAYRELIKRVCQQGENGTLEFELVGLRGTHRWLETHAVPFFDEEKGHTVLLGLTRDITVKKQAQQSLIKAYERAQFLSDASRVLVSSLDYETTLKGIARLIISQFADWCMIGVQEEDGSIQLLSMAADPSKAELIRKLEADPPEALSEAIRKGQAVLYSEMKNEESYPAPIQDPKYLKTIRELGLTSYMSVPLIVREKPVGVLMIASSREAHYYSEVDLALAEELASRSSIAVENARLYRESLRSIQLREDFISIASHELRTPLTPLKMQIFLLQRHLKSEAPHLPKGATLLQVLESSDRQLERLTKLVEDLLDVSRITRGRLTLNREECDLEEIVRDVTDRYKTELASSKCSLQLELEPNVKGSWDRLRIDQVVVNLLTNSMKYGAGKPIVVQAKKGEKTAKLVIRDFGIGITKKDQERIFQRFERAVPITTYGGLGLGLFIVRQIIAAHDGSIRVESEPEKGATFTVELPLEAAS